MLGKKRFLRGLPHLCKKMHRPGVAKKKAVNPDQEPDFYEISKMFPVPEEAPEDSNIALESTVRYGPRARVPVQPEISYRLKEPKCLNGNIAEINVKKAAFDTDAGKKIDSFPCLKPNDETNNSCSLPSSNGKSLATELPMCSLASNMNDFSTLAMTAATAIETVGRVKAVAEKQQVLLGQSLQQQMKQRQLIIAAANQLREYENAAAFANQRFNHTPYATNQISFATNTGVGIPNENGVSSTYLFNCLRDNSLFSTSSCTKTGDSQNVCNNNNNSTYMTISCNPNQQNNLNHQTQLPMDRDSAFRLAAAKALTSDQLAKALDNALEESRSQGDKKPDSSQDYKAWK